MKPTVRALIKRGFDSDLAERLHREGHTLAMLSQLSDDQLADLGIRPEQREALTRGRPRIPDGVVDALLYSCRSTCCVCRDEGRGVLVHHIVPWAESRSHDPSNLVVVCPVCHDRAHKSTKLTLELSPDRLRYCKREWEQKVRQSDAIALFTPQSWNLLSAIWDLFNRQRILDVSRSAGIEPASLQGFSSLTPDDDYLDRAYRWQGRLRSDSDGEYAYFENVLRALFDETDWLDLRRIWTRGEIRTLVREGTLFAFTAHHRFRSASERESGAGQTRSGFYKSRGIRLEFSFDAWECTSNSAYSQHLAGGWTCTTLGVVRSVEESNGMLRIAATCLALGTGFTEYSGQTPRIALEREMVEECLA